MKVARALLARLGPGQIPVASAILATATLVAALAHMGLGWAALTTPRVPEEPAAAHRASQSSSDVAAILTLAPFGEADLAGDSGPEGLQLKAVVQGQASASAALIAVRETPVREFAIGDLVDGGTRVEAIEIDHVVLRRDGRLVRLGFAKALPSTAADSASPAPLAAASGPPPDIGVVQASGFTLGAAPWPEMQRAGIRPGDTIATVNGLPVGDMERDVVDAIASGKARVEVVRDGRQVVLSAARDKE